MSMTDPHGWGQIAAQRQGVPDFGGLPPALLYALSGQITPGEYSQMQQPAPMDPTQAYVDAYGGNYLDPAMQAFQTSGGMAQKEQYWPDDIRAWEKMIADRSIKGAQAGYQVEQDMLGNQMDQERLALDRGRYGLAQEASQLQQYESAADVGSPDNDLMFLGTLGVAPQDLLADLEADPDGTYENLGTYLNLTDESGAPNWRTTANINRMMGVIRLAEQQATQSTQAQAQPAQPMDERTRWTQLTQPQRAKELYLGLAEGKEAVTDPRSGATYTGVGAAERMNKVRAQAATNRAKPKPQPKKWRAESTQGKGKSEGGSGQKWWTGGLGGALSWALSPKEYAKENPKARTPAEWFLGK